MEKIRVFLKRFFFLRLKVIKKRIKLYNKLSKLEDGALKEREILNYSKYYKKSVNLTNPATYSEKILWYKLHYKNPIFSDFADKWLLKEKTRELLEIDLCVKTLKVFYSIDEFNLDNLPEKFVMKMNNGTGYIYLGIKQKDEYIFQDLKDSNGPIYSFKQIKQIFALLFQLNHFYGLYEYCYKDITPVLMLEEYLEEVDLVDYKFHMNYGTFILLNVVSGRKISKVCDDYYDSDLNRLDVWWDNPPSEKPKLLPSEIKKMTKYASLLSKDFPISRIDFYIAANRIYLGEITFYQNAGYFNIKYPQDLDLILGQKFDISKELNTKE